MRFLNTLDGLLEHIKSVENETIDLTREGQLRIVRFLEKHKLVLDDDTMEAMQYQDIIAQQLSATIEAIENAQTHLRFFTRAFSEDDLMAVESIEKMHNKLTSALDTAKQKHSAYGGKLQHDTDDGIEFF